MVDSPLVNVQDSVVMGDVNYNTVHNHVLECPNCGMQGVPVIHVQKIIAITDFVISVKTLFLFGREIAYQFVILASKRKVRKRSCSAI